MILIDNEPRLVHICMSVYLLEEYDEVIEVLVLITEGGQLLFPGGPQLLLDESLLPPGCLLRGNLSLQCGHFSLQTGRLLHCAVHDIAGTTFNYYQYYIIMIRVNDI